MDNADYNKLLNDAKSYLGAQYDLLRLELLDKMSRIIGLIIMALVIVLLVFGAFAFFGMALVFLLSQVMELSTSCCILGGIFILIIALAYAFRNYLFINPVVGQLSKILFAEENSDAVAPAKTEEEVSHE
ncbi:MAG: phage holin family protein [Paludibacteraceae bacterium]|nr:phage holin family protein [Paludibacteraceae bacterium]